MPTKAALVIVFNHRYDKNIPVLEEIYAARFSDIYFLVPFYNGTKENVIPVFENSFRFQGYLAQGFKYYFRQEYEHYLFVADDLLLHPAINEHNYQEWFGLANKASFIPEIFELHNLTNNNTLRFLPTERPEKPWYWWRLKQLIHYSPQNKGLETDKELPSYEETKERLAQHGYHVQPLSVFDVFGSPACFTDYPSTKETAKYYVKRFKHRKGFQLPYPVVGSYSDLVVVHKSSIRDFTHYCGVFATNGLFVEFAIPTALLMASNQVVTELDLQKRGAIYWDYTKAEAERYTAALQPYQGELTSLLNNFPQDTLYIHPIKLSKWKYKTVQSAASPTAV